MLHFAVFALSFVSLASANEQPSAVLALDGSSTTQMISLRGESGYIERQEVPTGQTCERKIPLGTQCKEESSCTRPVGGTCQEWSYHLVCQEAYRTEYYPCTRVVETFIKTHDTVADIKVNVISHLERPIDYNERLAATLKLSGRAVQLKAAQLTGKVAIYEDSSRVVVTESPDKKVMSLRGEIDLKLLDPAVVLSAVAAPAKNFLLSADGLSFDLPSTKDASNVHLTLGLWKSRFLGKKALIGSAFLEPGDYELSGTTSGSRVLIPMRKLLEEADVPDLQAQLAKGTFKIELNTWLRTDLLIDNGAVAGRLIPGTLAGETSSTASAKIKRK